jgi:hypoxanthine phosphoribosyltransferase
MKTTTLTFDQTVNIAYTTIDKVRQAHAKNPFDAMIVVLRGGSFLGLWLSNILDLPTFFITSREFPILSQEIVLTSKNILLVEDAISTGQYVAEIIDANKEIKAVASLHFKADAQKVEGVEYHYGMLVSLNDWIKYPWET